MNHHSILYRRVLLAAAVASLMQLCGCSGDGSHCTHRDCRMVAGVHALEVPVADRWEAAPPIGEDTPPFRAPDTPTQLPPRGPGIRSVGPMLVEVDALVRASVARARYDVQGRGLVAAVIDTGVYRDHVDFSRGNDVVVERNFTSDNQGNTGDASDGAGHGTHVSGTILGNGIHTGIAPEAKLAALKALGNNGNGSFAQINSALQWVLDHHGEHTITVVNMSLGVAWNEQDESRIPSDFDETSGLIRALVDENVVVVISAGNSFANYEAEGMGYPAIVAECVSVGAVFDADVGRINFGSSGPTACSTDGDRVTPFSQRLSSETSPAHMTDVFAPGAPSTATGIRSDTSSAIMNGTSMSAPVTAGIVLLVQEYYRRHTGRLPSAAQVGDWLVGGGVEIHDGDDEHDTVMNTCRDYVRVDAIGALERASASVTSVQLMGLGQVRRISNGD